MYEVTYVSRSIKYICLYSFGTLICIRRLYVHFQNVFINMSCYEIILTSSNVVNKKKSPFTIMLFLFSLLLKNSRQLFVGYNSASSVSIKWKLCSLCSTLAEFDLLEALCNVKLPIACGQMRPNILPGN